VAERLDDFVIHLKDKDAAVISLPVATAGLTSGKASVKVYSVDLTRRVSRCIV